MCSDQIRIRKIIRKHVTLQTKTVVKQTFSKEILNKGTSQRNENFNASLHKENKTFHISSL